MYLTRDENKYLYMLINQIVNSPNVSIEIIGQINLYKRKHYNWKTMKMGSEIKYYNWKTIEISVSHEGRSEIKYYNWKTMKMRSAINIIIERLYLWATKAIVK